MDSDNVGSTSPWTDTFESAGDSGLMDDGFDFAEKNALFTDVS